MKTLLLLLASLRQGMIFRVDVSAVPQAAGHVVQQFSIAAWTLPTASSPYPDLSLGVGDTVSSGTARYMCKQGTYAGTNISAINGTHADICPTGWHRSETETVIGQT